MWAIYLYRWKWRELESVLYNDYLITRPIYRIVGEGYLTLTINNKTIKANVGQELIIDTDKGLCYRNGIVNNVSHAMRYEICFYKKGKYI